MSSGASLQSESKIKEMRSKKVSTSTACGRNEKNKANKPQLVDMLYLGIECTSQENISPLPQRCKTSSDYPRRGSREIDCKETFVGIFVIGFTSLSSTPKT